MNKNPNDLREHTMNSRFDRRHLLRGAGTRIALPGLESFGFRRFASAAEAVPAKPPKPTLAAKAMAMIEAAPTQEEQVQYARSIRMLKSGWTDELKTTYFEWFLKAANYRGGASFEKFIQFIRDDAVASLTESQKESLKEILAKKPVKKSALENLGEIFAGRAEIQWTLDELTQAAGTDLTHRDFANGRKMFAAAGCYACHRFQNQGGMTGPDLTTSGRRYSVRDLLDQVIFRMSCRHPKRSRQTPSVVCSQVTISTRHKV